MDLAASLYKGGQLISATESDYSTSRELGLICPFCKESVYLVRGHLRQGKMVTAAWRHYKYSPQSNYCERRAVSGEGKAILAEFKPQARNQRLKLFNRRFWEIFCYKKAIPGNLKKTLLRFMSAAKLEKMCRHCHERWDAEAIKAIIPEIISFRLKNKKAEEYLRSHPSLKGAIPEIAENLVEEFVNIKFSVLRLKILHEVIDWLETKTAFTAFEKIIQLSLYDCLEILPFPVHSQSVQDMAITSLVLTDWEEAIASLDSKTRAIGFGKI